MIRLFFLLLSAFALSACGGGGTVGTFSANKIFSDGAGVGRLTVKRSNEQGYLIAPDIVAVGAELNSITGNDLIELNPDDFPVIQVLSNGTRVHQGAVISNGIGVNLTMYVEPGEETTIAYYSVPGYANMLLATGVAYTQAPSGNYTYSGTQIAGPRGNFNTSPSVGSFDLSANFDTSSFSYSGVSSNYSLSGSGYINKGNGQLSSSNMNFQTGGSNRTATLNGLLHGSSAQGVSGVFYTNESNPAFAGGFSGTR